MTDRELHEQIKSLIRQSLDRRPREAFVPGKTRIPLSVPSFDWEEVWEALESMLSGQVTMGEKVARFEQMFAEYIGVKHAIMVNSGSSANLLALSILTNPALEDRLRPGDEVITPAVTWATTVWPIINVGLVPVLVDVDPTTFNLIPDEVERAIAPRTRAILLVHLLGNPCPMAEIMDIARWRGLLVIEDACEAHGAEYQGRKVGSFGDMATFSFFFSHHITTIEGGMLVTNRDDYAELARALRTFGWIRHLRDREGIIRRYPELDPRFLFINYGYNLRPTEIQGAFGIHQLGRLERFIETRRENARYWHERLGRLPHLMVHRESPGTRHVWLGYPILLHPDATFERKELVDSLEAWGVETRPIMAGNISEQPGIQLYPHRVVGELPNARWIHRCAFLFGNHQGITRTAREAIADRIEQFLTIRADT